MNIIALFSSSRRNGNTGSLLDSVASQLPVEIVELDNRSISGFDYDHNRNDDFELLMDYVLNFDKIIFASPEYWYSVSPSLKIFIDRISDYLDIPELLPKGRRLRGKTGYIITTSVYDKPSSPFIGAFENTFDYLGMYYGGCLHVNCKNGFNQAKSHQKIQKFIEGIKAL